MMMVNIIFGFLVFVGVVLCGGGLSGLWRRLRIDKSMLFIFMVLIVLMLTIVALKLGA